MGPHFTFLEYMNLGSQKMFQVMTSPSPDIHFKDDTHKANSKQYQSLTLVSQQQIPTSPSAL